MHDKNSLDQSETPTGHIREGQHITADQRTPMGEPTNRTCPDCKRKQYKYGRFYICQKHHAYNEQGTKIDI